MRPEQALSIGLDLLALLCLIGLRTRVPKALFWIAIVAGLALFAIPSRATPAGGSDT